MLQGKLLRVARPTDRLDQVVHFYTEGLGLHILYRFENHDGFDGVMVGMPEEAYHFEFTHHRGHSVGRAPTQDNLIVFYLPEQIVPGYAWRENSRPQASWIPPLTGWLQSLPLSNL